MLLSPPSSSSLSFRPLQRRQSKTHQLTVMAAAAASKRRGEGGEDDYHSTVKALNSRGRRTPRKSLGQHYMVNSSINEQLAGVAQVGDGDVVLEIGPGTGSLTNVLINAGATVVAVEKLCGFLSNAKLLHGLTARSGRRELEGGGDPPPGGPRRLTENGTQRLRVDPECGAAQSLSVVSGIVDAFTAQSWRNLEISVSECNLRSRGDLVWSRSVVSGVMDTFGVLEASGDLDGFWQLTGLFCELACPVSAFSHRLAINREFWNLSCVKAKN